MSYARDARDATHRLAITDSCRLIKNHASFIGVMAADVTSMPADYMPGCMDELNEAAGVMQAALERIEKAKQTLLAKSNPQDNTEKVH